LIIDKYVVNFKENGISKRYKERIYELPGGIAI
jgi:hypothetical protein